MLPIFTVLSKSVFVIPFQVIFWTLIFINEVNEETHIAYNYHHAKFALAIWKTKILNSIIHTNCTKPTLQSFTFAIRFFFLFLFYCHIWNEIPIAIKAKSFVILISKHWPILFLNIVGFLLFKVVQIFKICGQKVNSKQLNSAIWLLNG